MSFVSNIMNLFLGSSREVEKASSQDLLIKDIWLHISNILSIKDLCNLSLVSKHLHEFVRDNQLIGKRVLSMEPWTSKRVLKGEPIDHLLLMCGKKLFADKIPTPDPICSVAIEGSTIACASLYKVVLFDLLSGETVAEIPCPYSQITCSIVLEKPLVSFIFSKTMMCVGNFETQKHEYFGGKEILSSLSMNEGWLVSGGGSCKVTLIDTKSFDVARWWAGNDRPFTCVSIKGNRVAGGDEGGYHFVWDRDSGDTLYTGTSAGVCITSIDIKDTILALGTKDGRLLTCHYPTKKYSCIDDTLARSVSLVMIQERLILFQVPYKKNKKSENNVFVWDQDAGKLVGEYVSQGSAALYGKVVALPQPGSGVSLKVIGTVAKSAPETILQKAKAWLIGREPRA